MIGEYTEIIFLVIQDSNMISYIVYISSNNSKVIIYILIGDQAKKLS